jgi:hypothetical protein
MIPFQGKVFSLAFPLQGHATNPPRRPHPSHPAQDRTHTEAVGFKGDDTEELVVVVV